MDSTVSFKTNGMDIDITYVPSIKEITSTTNLSLFSITENDKRHVTINDSLYDWYGL